MEKKVKDHTDLVRLQSGAVVNKDTRTYENFINQRKQLEEQKARINNLEQELLNIKLMVSKLLS